MPIYEYRCAKCKKTFEKLQKFSDEPLKIHEDCGGEVTKLMAAPAFQFKGSGWYVTDYGKGGVKPKSSESNDSKSHESSKSDSGDSKSSDGKSGDSKPSDSKSGESKSAESSSGSSSSNESKSEVKASSSSSSESKTQDKKKSD